MFAVRADAAAPLSETIRQSARNGQSVTMRSTLLDPQMLLVEEDFPSHFIQCRHPSDYNVQDAPITPECIYHMNGLHKRLFLRVSFKCKGGYIPITFLLDTGSPFHFYLSNEAMNVLTQHSIIKFSDGRLSLSDFYARLRYHETDESIHSFIAQVRETPYCYEPANIAGLSALSQLGMCVYKEKVFFKSKITWL